LEESRIRARKKQEEKIASIRMKVCPQCQKEFNPYNTRRNPYKTYCSKECQIKFTHRVQTKRRNEILKNPSLDLVAYRKYKLRKQVQDCNYKAFSRGCTKDDENHISLKSWKDILERNGNRCTDCGTTENITIDHIHPISRGGKNNKNNIQPLCRKCNSTKSAKIISIPHTSLN
jgi:5-methylcytosine-specific restriction endonuclease McrA